MENLDGQEEVVYLSVIFLLGFHNGFCKFSSLVQESQGTSLELLNKRHPDGDHTALFQPEDNVAEK